MFKNNDHIIKLQTKLK